jgi:hypothetical protein
MSSLWRTPRSLTVPDRAVPRKTNVPVATLCSAPELPATYTSPGGRPADGRTSPRRVSPRWPRTEWRFCPSTTGWSTWRTSRRSCTTSRRPCGGHIFGGFTFADVAGTTPNTCLLTHSPTTQGSWTSIRNQGRDGHQWWVLTATDPDAPAPADSPGRRRRAGRRVPRPTARPDRGHSTGERATLGAARPPRSEAVVQRAGHARRRRSPPDFALRGLRRRYVDRGRLLPRPGAPQCRSH